MFLISFLYQTTTSIRTRRWLTCCFLSLSYIKPQLNVDGGEGLGVVSYLFPISNHNLPHWYHWLPLVVSYLFPISNHNGKGFKVVSQLLFLISFLYQTTTFIGSIITNSQLFLISFLYQTTTAGASCLAVWALFLISFLYQTTTLLQYAHILFGCFLSLSYIKPQPFQI